MVTSHSIPLQSVWRRYLWIAISLCVGPCWAQTGTPVKWYQRTNGVPEAFSLSSCAYGQGIFVAVGGGKSFASPDGAHWTWTNAPSLSEVCAGDDHFWACGEGGLYRSTNGVLWEPVQQPVQGVYRGVAASGRQVLAFGEFGERLTSRDSGTTWVRYQDPTFHTPRHGAIVNGNFVVLWNRGVSSYSVFVSSNGTEWVSTSLDSVWSLGGICVADNRLVVACRSGPSGTEARPAIITTADGLQWSGPAMLDIYPSRLGYGNGLFVALQGQGPEGWSSSDLAEWQPMDFSAVGAVYQEYADPTVPYGAGTFVGVGKSTILQSDSIVPAGPVIETHPESKAIYEGADATFCVSALGSRPFTYQWRHNGQSIPGATNSTLVVVAAKTADAGWYDVVVTNQGGSATSKAAQLEVSWLSIHRYAGLKLSGEPGSTNKIEYIESTGSTNWLLLTNVVVPTTPYIWIDLDSPNHPQRFYRAARP